MLCTLAEPHMRQTLPTELSVNGTVISRVEKMRYLGVILDHKLAFTENAVAAAVKAKKAVGALWRTVGQWAGRDVFRRIYESQVQPVLTHALPMVSPATKFGWHSLEKVHRYAGRLSLNDFRASYTDLLRRLQWKNMSRLCVERQALHMYKWRNGLRFLPEGVITEKPPSRTRRGQVNKNRDQLVVNNEIFIPRPTFGRQRETAERNPLFQCVNLWNNLPEVMPNLELNEFKREIRKYEVYNMLQTRAWNIYTATRPAVMSQDYFDL